MIPGEMKMDLKEYLLADRSIPLEDATVFSILLRTPDRGPHSEPVLTKEAKKGIIKLMMSKRAQEPDLEAAMMVDPAVQQALDYQQAMTEAAVARQQAMALQEQLQGMQQGMAQLEQRAQTAEQQVPQLQQQLQGEMQMRQQSNMQAMQANDAAIKTQAAAQQHRMQLSQAADQMAIQLKQLASQDPVQAMQQQEQAQAQAAQQEQMAQQEAAKAQMPPKQRKEVEQAEKAQQQAQVQGQQAEQAQVQGQVQQQMGGQSKQGSAGLTLLKRALLNMKKGKTKKSQLGEDMYDTTKTGAVLSDTRRESLKSSQFAVPAAKAKKIGVGDEVQSGEKGKYPIPDEAHARNALARVSQFGTPAEREAVRTKVYSKYPQLREGFEESHGGESPTSKENVKKEQQGNIGKNAAASKTDVQKVQLVSDMIKKTKGMSVPQRKAFMKGVGKEIPNQKSKESELEKCDACGKSKASGLAKCEACGGKSKMSELEKEECSSSMKVASLKARLLEGGIGAGVGALGAGTYEALRKKDPTGAPSEKEIELNRRHMAAKAKAQSDPSLLNRLNEQRLQAAVDVERDMRENPKHNIARRALQGAIVGGVAGPSVAAIKRHLSPKITG